MIFYLIITLIVMLLFAGALSLGRLFKKQGYQPHDCAGGSGSCSCERSRPDIS